MCDDNVVYILGAGFSKAIDEKMPLMDDLGKQCANIVDNCSYKSGSFEQWMTIMLQDLPFLDESSNLKRKSEVLNCIDAIAHILDRITNQIQFAITCPLWLRQFVNLIAAEKACIITFNYDTLLEVAINYENPIVKTSVNLRRVVADQVVFPRPFNTITNRVGDFASTTPCKDVMQILKPHGSLNWYWDSGEGGESLLYRLRERRVYNDRLNLFLDEVEEMRGMRRFIIPPTGDKTRYYGQGLDRRIWKEAGKALSEASRLVVIGYSFPETDYVVNELIKQKSGNIGYASVVDPYPERICEKINKYLANAHIDSIGGTECVSEYVYNSIVQRGREVLAKLKTDSRILDVSSVAISTKDNCLSGAPPDVNRGIDIIEGEIVFCLYPTRALTCQHAQETEVQSKSFSGIDMSRYLLQSYSGDYLIMTNNNAPDEKYIMIDYFIQESGREHVLILETAPLKLEN